ncbi:hypothetical protein DFH08DRAFT_838308 [Mycena albidolilacea]|uniref:Uncharacterized protein n=1 Tax=Mycena albidolilacea TaxID=1033008 RepID=A0AAD7F324_9AGAR|nr:hypothetical protein DFH08DRAFT_838308 [Mycena albidolilacea]
MLTFPERCWTTIKSVYYRITLSRFTIAFFLFCFIHCFAEGFIQAFIFSLDANANSIVTSILHQAEVPRTTFGVLDRHNGNNTLSLCNEIPTYISTKPCKPVYQTGNPNLPLPVEYGLAGNASASVFLQTQSEPGGVLVSLDDGAKILMNQRCTLVLTYPHQVLMNAQREDVVLVLTQFWIFSVSFFAIVYDSIPHLVAALCFRTLATAWSMYIIWRTGDIRSRFEILLHTKDSPCNVEVDALFPSYFLSREALQIPDLVLNVVSLCMAVYLSIKLIKVYGPNTFNRVGASKEIIRIYKYFLAVFVSFQVAALLLISAIALWLDQMVNTDNAISGMTYHKNIYLALSIFTLAILVPWITMGWYAVRREWKKLMAAFLAIAAFVFTGWVVMLKSWSFAWTFVQWPFFACSIIAASLSLLATIIFGVISWLHFGKGLAHYLYVDDVLAKAGFEPELFEKDVENHPPADWREIGLDDVPTYTLSFSTERKDLGELEKGDYK